jgi:hypothetical protein
MIVGSHLKRGRDTKNSWSHLSNANNTLFNTFSLTHTLLLVHVTKLFNFSIWYRLMTYEYFFFIPIILNTTILCNFHQNMRNSYSSDDWTPILSPLASHHERLHQIYTNHSSLCDQPFSLLKKSNICQKKNPIFQNKNKVRKKERKKNSNKRGVL